MRLQLQSAMQSIWPLEPALAGSSGQKWLFSITLLIALASQMYIAPSSYAGSLHLGDKASNFTLKSLSGPNEKLSEQRGKIIVLTFWASWCGSCQPHLQLLNRLVQVHADKGMELWVVSLDEKKKSTLKTVKKLGLNATVLLDEQQDIAEQYLIDELPTTVIIDRDGVMRYVHVDFSASDENRYQNELLRVATE